MSRKCREIISTPYLVFGVGGVHPLAVSAGLQQDLDGAELQQDLAGHAVEEGDVGQSCRRQQENLPTGGALTQLYQITVPHQDPVTAGNTFSLHKNYLSLQKWKLCGPHLLMSAVTMSCMLSRKLARCCVDVW